EVKLHAAAGGDGDDAGARVDGEAVAGIDRETVGDRAAVDIAGCGGDADRAAVGGAFGDRAAAGAVTVGRRGRGHVGDGDREGLGREESICVGRLDGDVV